MRSEVYITPATLGVPNAWERGTKLEVAHKRAGWLRNPYCLGGPNALECMTKSEGGHKWAGWLKNPCHPRGSQRSTVRNKTGSGPLAVRVAT